MVRLKVSPEFSFPEDAVTSTILTYGGKGMGKSNSGAVFLEELSKNSLRWSALDPMGVLWGLRYSADGKGSGIECLILGGPHGDIPIEPTGGAVVADLVVNESVNVIIDFSRKRTGEMWGVGERIRFVNDYGKRLYQLQGSLIDGKRREPIFQLIDEAARFMPQTIRQGEVDAAKCLSTWSTIVEEGRNVGIGVGLLTQRSARLNKDVAELADCHDRFSHRRAKLRRGRHGLARRARAEGKDQGLHRTVAIASPRYGTGRLSWLAADRGRRADARSRDV